MPDHHGLPLFRWGEELRRTRQWRRARRRRLLTLLAIAAGLGAVATMFWPPRPLILWNSSESMPRGLYLVGPPSHPTVGDTVVAWAPPEARALAAERGYLPARVPLVKRVGAVAGDRVCAVGEAVFVNGVLAVLRRYKDAQGRPLSGWTGCTELRRGQLLLLAPANAYSFDGRYFGPIEATSVIGKGRLLWAL